VQLVMFVDDAFAAGNQGVLYSEAFPGAKHSLTIASLEAAVGGNAAELAWFTDTFFNGPAAAAVFDTHGSFSVAEFTALDTIGGAVTVGDWTLKVPFVFIPGGQPGSHGGRPTGVLDEGAVSPGPFDIEFTVDDDGSFAVDKSVTNDTELPIIGFTLQVGTGTGENFVPSANAQLQFVNEAGTSETTGAFPDMDFGANLLSFDGLLAPAAEANFVFFVFTSQPGEHDVTVRQRAIFASEDARATFTVRKNFYDNNPSAVEVSINCFTGLPLQQSQEITEEETVEFVVTDFDAGELDCNVDEAVPNGYSPTYAAFDNGGSAGSVTADEDGCHFGDVLSGEFQCEILNTPDPVDVVIHKEWVIEGPGTDIDTSYRLTLFCEGEIVGGSQLGGSGVEGPAGVPQPSSCGFTLVAGVDSGQTNSPEAWCKEFNGDGPDTFEAQVIPQYPDSDCEVIETVYDSAVEVDNDCGSLVVSAGEGASCTITNTVFFEGIPTLSQYGLAILALLMLSVGFVTFRRIV